MWRRDNGRRVMRTVVYDPRSLARIWVMDEATGDYIAVPYRMPHPDMTLAESMEARRRLHVLKAADRNERRLFDNLEAIRGIEAQAKTTTARRKAERTRQARDSAVPAAEKAELPGPPVPILPPISADSSALPAAPAGIEPFADVEAL
jgi:hypothetical protein